MYPHAISLPPVISPHLKRIMKWGNKEVIRLALYDSISPSVNLLEKALNYEWEKNGVGCELIAERIDNDDVLGEN